MNDLFTVLVVGSCLLLSVMAIAGLLFVSASFATGVLAGGLIAIVNCFWLRFTLLRAMRLTADKAVRFALVRYLLRLAMIGLAVSVLIIHVKTNIPGLLLGLSVLVINTIGVTIYISTRKGG